MSDYQLLLAAMDEYKAELKRRKEGVEIEVWENGITEKERYRPANKARLNRLRLEITGLMLRIERQMCGGPFSIKYKEGWE